MDEVGFKFHVGARQGRWGGAGGAGGSETRPYWRFPDVGQFSAEAHDEEGVVVAT